jgi:ectoine hydroxylase-related dioxygenase (phytanoyl-CoA dioxygenase family)
MLSTGRVDLGKLEEEIYRNGYTALPAFINEHTCDQLRKWLDESFHADLPYNYSPGHCLLYLPKTAEHLPSEIVFNETIHNLLKEILGKNYYLYSYSCNANWAEEDQPYHMDCSHFHSKEVIKKFGSPGPPHQLICNVYLQDTNETNGSLDMVPGSHLDMDFEIDEEGRIDPQYIKTSHRCNFPKGTLIIRDKRTWHRGTKNTSGVVRYMVGCSFSSHWQKFGNLTFEEDCSDLFGGAPFSTHNILFQ